jgi:hypothetical protein
MSLLLTVAHSGLDLYDARQQHGVIGYDEWAKAIGRTLFKWARHAHSIDSAALDDMVTSARALVPHDTGLLYNGIEGEEVDDTFEFRASAQRTSASGKLSADYASFVEFGTEPHGPTAEVTSAFARRRGRGQGHPGTAPQPFFFPAAREILIRRALDLESLIGPTAQEEGWELLT